MVDQLRGLTSLTENPLTSYSSLLFDSCKQLVPLISNKTTYLNDPSNLPQHLRQFIIKKNLTSSSFISIPECIFTLARYINNTNESDISIKDGEKKYGISDHSQSLIVFVTLIGCVSLISIIGNLCLAKVLYSKRYRLIQTDRIVLCLALSELCLVSIDTPTEIYRFISYSFSQEWLCRFHTFFEALFSSCIIFYHLLGAFDRFVYIHGHTSSDKSCWSRWYRRISTKSGSLILLILPIICSLPLAICNFLHASILHTSLTNKTCTLQYTHGILIGLLISFYILPLLISFFLHAKLIYFIRTRHNQHYLTTTTAYILPMKRNNTIEFQSKRRLNQGNPNAYDRLLLKPKRSSHRHHMMTNTETLGSTITTTAAVQSAPVNPNNSSNSSQSSRSSTGTSSTSITSPIVLYKINSEANANANRTVLLLVLLLSFYVFCWAPYNIYTWLHAYELTQLSYRSKNNLTSFYILNQTISKNNLNADLRRIIYINYSLYLLSMISMCFSFIFYFSLNKQARHEFSRFIGCICPWIIPIRNEKKQRRKYPKEPRQLQYRTRFQNQHAYNNDRIKNSPSSLLDDRYKHMNYLKNGTPKRTVLNYGCQIQCCP